MIITVKSLTSALVVIIISLIAVVLLFKHNTVSAKKLIVKNNSNDILLIIPVEHINFPTLRPYIMPHSRKKIRFNLAGNRDSGEFKVENETTSAIDTNPIDIRRTRHNFVKLSCDNDISSELLLHCKQNKLLISRYT